MRISDRFGQGFWTTGLVLAIVIGSYGIAAGQVQSQFGGIQPTNDTAAKVETWLADARKAIAEGKQKEAEQFVQVAESIANQPGNTLPAGFTFDAIKAQIANMSSEATPATAEESAARNTLLKARQYLAQGHLPEAQSMVEQAKAMTVDFAKVGDSPAVLEAMLQKQNDLVEMARGNDAKAYNQQAGAFLVEQATALVEYQDYQTAETLVDLALQFPADYKSLGLDPQAMLVEIKSAKSQVVAAPSTQLSDNSPAKTSDRDAVLKLMSQAQLAMDQERWEDAGKYVAQAKAFNMADSEFEPGMMRPWQMELLVAQHLNKSNEVMPANGVASNRNVVQADYVPENDESRIVQVAAEEDNSFNPIPSRGMQLYRSGLDAMDREDSARAKDLFESALDYRQQLDQATTATIEAHLASFQQESGFAEPLPAQMNNLDDQQQDIFRRLQAEVFKERSSAERMLETSPRNALEKMTFVRNRVSDSQLDNARKKPLLTIIDRDINEMQQYIESNLSEILNEESNAAALAEVERRQQNRLDTEQQIQRLIEDFNKLLDQRRWAEAQAVAQQAYELDPQSEIVAQLMITANMTARLREMEELGDAREAAQYSALGPNIERSVTPIDDRMPYQFNENRDEWLRRSQERLERFTGNQYGSDAERQIWNVLKNTRVQGEYTGTLSEAVDQLSSQAGVNIIFDSVALGTLGVSTNTAVDVPIREPISLRSALNVILGTQGLVFVVEDEVIKVTSEDAQRKKLVPVTYYVGDLITPVQAQANSAQMNFITPSKALNSTNSVLANNNSPFQAPTQNAAAGPMNMVAMAQQMPNSPFSGFGGGYGGNGFDGPQTGIPTYTTTGAPQLGGITEADFTNLVELIKSTIAPDDWDDTNGDGSINPFVPNLSLIVSQTQEVQDQIQDLLERLRELNDVQIVVEVRFIVLADSFFERIGIDFDFSINDNSGLTSTNLGDEFRESVVVGLDAEGNPRPDLDIAFNQDSFGSVLPTFGGFDVGSAANFGFAILSDIEVLFLIQASKGDQRSNITQAPTVTMFNGQSASVSDFSQRPFVTSVIPVVGDFAVAHQPVISLLPDGTTLNVQATASHDRRFVRLSLVPFFSQVTDVETFTFDGSTTTRRASDNLLQDLLNQVAGNNPNDLEELETIDEGVTIQLPVIAITSVNTVVSVPDGGTVLMGGIKRMSEARVERGLPFLSNVPYVNRLFKNVGIGRETSNLMMMVTPRIIIQEEEERFQVGPIGGN